MPRRCSKCSRANPSEAAYCYYDGIPLNGAGGAAGESINYGVWAFPTPFVFPAGETCRNFLQLALACQRDPRAATDMLRQGYLEKFFGSLGRVDLAMAAAAAAKAPDKERGLDDLLGKMPGTPLQPPQLQVEPTQKDLGVVPVGEDRRFELTLTNAKDRLVYGKAAVENNCPWIVLGDPGSPEKLFQFFDKATIAVRIVGKRLRAYEKPQRAEIVLESNAGTVTVVVGVSVPVNPFPEGVLSGALSPRQLAAKAKQHVKEAAVLIENGAVARWYESNRWTYPVQGPTASGQAAVQQLFETLGLVKPPKVELSEPAVTLRGKPGQRLEYVVSVVTQEKRAAVAYGASDQPWLTVGRPTYRGQTATIPLIVEEVPGQPGATLTACLKVTANGNQRFDVPVTLSVGDGPAVRSSKPTPVPASAAPAPEPSPFAFEAPAAVASAPAPSPAPFAFDAPAPPPVTPAPSPSPALASPAAAVAATAPAPTPVAARPLAGLFKQRALWMRLLPIGIVAIGLMTAVGRDLLFREARDPELPAVDYDHPVLGLKFHDALQPNDFLPAPSMRFGLGTPDLADPKKFKTKLVYDEFGRTNNVCVRIGQKPDAEYLWGVEQGQWKPMKQDLGYDQEGHRLIGAKAVWVHSGPPITIAQYVEIVPGGLSPDGKKRLLDTCLIRYDITNDDGKVNAVGLRFLLDTYIGSNDAVPFTIAGAKELCNTMKEFNKAEDVPDFISAQEHQDLQKPGIVAHLSLKYGGGLEAPTRVTLGAWPVSTLRELPGGVGAKADGPNTHWDVPVVPMADAKSAENPDGDSAVTLYWDVKELQPKQTRTVGFAYGLGSVTGDGGEGQLGMTAGGEVAAGKEFTLTAYVKNPAPDATLALTLPRGMELTEGREKESVAPVPAGSSSPYSPVTWKVRATKGGVYTIGLTLNSGAKLQHKLVVPASLEVLH